MNYRSVKALITAMLIALTAAAGTVPAGTAPGGRACKGGSAAVDTAGKQPTDKELMEKFRAVIRKMQLPKTVYTITGVMNVTDKKIDVRPKRLPFVLSRQGDAVYYRMGATETINADGIFLFIDNGGKVATLSAQKDEIAENGLSNLAAFGEIMGTEGYKLSSKTVNQRQTITFLNEYHVTCKQYAISFNKNTLAVDHLLVRLSDAEDPLNAKKDKVLDISFSEWDGKANLGRFYKKGNILKNSATGWKMTNRYKNYKLIQL